VRLAEAARSLVPRGSGAGNEAVRLARGTPGVRRVETYFVDSQPSPVGDLEIKEKIKATLVADPRVTEGRVDVAVHGGHVVLVGVVGSWQTADDFVDDADP
jgi:osmotically-inducible protein OsmY